MRSSWQDCVSPLQRGGSVLSLISSISVALGFGTPPITSSLKPFTGVIPNVIALPYGRCPPFHISAPSWRSMLRLMARLSGSRLEPTMEALAIVKTEMRLRVVVSFVKVCCVHAV